MKKLLKIVVALVLVFIIVLAVAWFKIDAIAKATLEKGGTYALGVDITVDHVNVSLLGGSVGLSGLQIANPPGFDAPYLMHTGDFKLQVATGSLMSDTIEVPLIELDKLDLHIQKNDKGNNISPILDHLKKFQGGAAAKEKTGSSKKFVIKKLVIKGVTAHLDVPPLGTKAVTVPDIVLENVTQDNAQGMAMDEVMARVFPMITAAAISSLTDLPGDLAGTLTSDLSGVADHLGGTVGNMIKDPAKLLGNVGEKAGKSLDDAAKEIGKTIGDLFGGKKDEPKK